jgi:hypothetical protein
MNITGGHNLKEFNNTGGRVAVFCNEWIFKIFKIMFFMDGTQKK